MITRNAIVPYRPAVRVSPENPSTNLATAAKWLFDAFGATETWAGNTVNEKTALTYAAAYACINVLAKDLAQLPCFVYKRTDDDLREPDREHDVWRVMHDRPNPWMTPFTFKQTIHAHVASWGNGYAEIEYDNAGRVRHLWPLLPDRMKIVIRNGKKVFLYKADPQKEPIALPAERVLHIMGLSSDGIRGYSVIQVARNAIGMGLAAEEFTGRLFSNGATPRFALLHPKTLSPEAKQRLQVKFDASTTGLSNAHRTAVFEEGLQLEKIGLPAKDAEMIETSKFGIEQMARFFDIPMMRLHSTTAITSWGTGLEQWQRAYLVHTLGPWLVQWEEAINYSLFTEEERQTHFAEFKREALLQADHAARGQFYTQMLQTGSISPNEIARRENLPPAGKEGDKRFIPGNLLPLEDAGKQLLQPEPEPGEGPSKKKSEGEEKAVDLTEKRSRQASRRLSTQRAFQRAYQQAAERVVTKHVQRTTRQVEKLAKDGDLAGFQQWVRKFYEDERPAIAEAFLPTTIALHQITAADALQDIGRVHNGTFDVPKFSEKYVEALAIRQSLTESGALLKITQDPNLQPTNIVAQLTEKLADWSGKRAAQIAKHEATQAGNAITRHIYEEAGVERLVWVTTGDGCSMCQAMNGRTVSISAPFVGDGETVGNESKSLTADGSISHPPLHGGCDCQLVAA